VKAATSRQTASHADEAIAKEVQGFVEKHGRMPCPDAVSHEEMRLGVIWSKLSPESYQAIEAPAPKNWREEPDEADIPDSLDDIFGDDGLDVDPSLIQLEHVTPAADRHVPDHRADFVPCRDFHLFEERFVEIQAALESGERKALP